MNRLLGTMDECPILLKLAPLSPPILLLLAMLLALLLLHEPADEDINEADMTKLGSLMSSMVFELIGVVEQRFKFSL